MEALLYFVIWAAVIFLMMRAGCGSHILGDDKSARSGTSSDLRWIPPETDMDPVCGKTVHTDQGKTSVFDGLVYYFCSCECREIFEAAPELYVGKDRSAIGKSLEDSHV